jgi:rubredoxin
MEKKPYNDKQNSLFDQIKLMKNCPQCKAEYTKEAFEIVEEGTGTHLVHLTCSHCANAMLALIVISKLGMSSVGMLTDLSALDAKHFHHKDALDEESVLGFHDCLFQNSKEFIHLLTS